MAKQTRASFPHSNIQTTSTFQLIHIDVWGPYKVISHDGYNQFLTIVDDYNRFTWLHLVKHRTKCVKILKDFLSHVETQYKAKVAISRFDNAPELCQGSMKEFYLQKGIVHQTSCSHTPQ